MEKHDGDQKGPMTTLQGSTVENPDSTRRIVVRASPNLVFTPPVSRMHSEWTPFLNRDWNDVFPEISPEALGQHPRCLSLFSDSVVLQLLTLSRSRFVL